MIRRGNPLSYDEMVGEGHDISDDAFNPETISRYDEKQAMLQAGIAQLDQRSRAAINLFYFEQMSQKQIAEILGTTSKAVESLVARARQTLKEVCNEDIQIHGS